MYTYKSIYFYLYTSYIYMLQMLSLHGTSYFRQTVYIYIYMYIYIYIHMSIYVYIQNYVHIEPTKIEWMTKSMDWTRPPFSRSMMHWPRRCPRSSVLEPSAFRFLAKGAMWSHEKWSYHRKTIGKWWFIGIHIYIYRYRYSGWWFGTWLLFFNILGISSSQLTHISQRGSNHQPVFVKLS